jgi:hypothetical protein
MSRNFYRVLLVYPEQGKKYFFLTPAIKLSSKDLTNLRFLSNPLQRHLASPHAVLEKDFLYGRFKTYLEWLDENTPLPASDHYHKKFLHAHYAETMPPLETVDFKITL